MATCWHTWLTETGICPRCSTEVTVQTGYRVTATLPSGVSTQISELPLPARPSARDAIATLLGISPARVKIIDSREVEGRHGGKATEIIWSLTGSRVTSTIRLESSSWRSCDPASTIAQVLREATDVR